MKRLACSAIATTVFLFAAVDTVAGTPLDARPLKSDNITVSFSDDEFPAVAASAASAVPSRRPRDARDARDTDLDIHIFTHSDVAPYFDQRAIHEGYVAWWLDDLVGRVLPFQHVNVRYHPFVDGVSNIPYHHSGALIAWTAVARQWAESEDYAFDESHKNKFLLLTLAEPIPGMSGVAWQGGNAALASIAGRYRIVAHEIGHLLGAQHDDAEIRYDGWWCESNMFAQTIPLRSNCFGYSDANERRIRAYVIEAPGHEWQADRGPPIVN